MATSQNGYTAAASKEGIPSGTVRVGAAGSKARFTVRKDVADAFQYLLDEFHTRVESIDLYTKPGGDDWGYAPRPIRGSSSTLSNHASATAVDINATRHPLGVGGNMGFTTKQIAEIRKILREMRGVFRWGGDYSGRKDGMHFELHKPKAEVLRVMADLREPDVYKPDPENFGTVYLSKLHPGVKDSDSVWQFQLALIKLGYDIPSATGDYGPKTTAAVKAFQQADKELAVDADGDTGPLTARKVFERAGNVVKVED